MTIVDTTVWIDYFGGIANRHTLWVRREVGVISLALVDLIFCEVLQGIRDDGEFARVRDRLMTLPILDTGGSAFALAAARNYRLLRERGRTIRTTIDCLIATFCIESGHELLHRDRDFDPFETHLGLSVVHP